MTVIINGTTGIDAVQDAKISPAKLTTNGSGGFTLPTSAGNAVVADSSGRVTMPYQPSFHVRVNNYAWIQTSPIPWSQAVYDVGSNFNLSTYRFTAPIAGKYFFIAQVLCHSQTSEYAAIFLRKNGSNVTYSEVANSTVNNNNTRHITAVLNLSANDYIDFAFDASGGDYYGGNQETNLYGWLLG